jgi:hypothetical protein
MSVDFVGLGALVLVSLEWLALGWLSGIRFAEHAPVADVASCALRLLIGASLVGLAELVLSLLGVGFSGIASVLAVAAVFAIGLRASRAAAPAACENKPLRVERREWIGWALLGLLVVGGLVRSVLVPESGWDAYSHWGLRAQAFANAGTVVNAHSEHEYYPPLVPLLEAWLYVHRGLVSINLGKTVWAVTGSAFAVCLAWHLRLALRLAWLAPYLAAAIMLTTTALLEGFWTGQADLALTAYLTLATLAAWRWQQQAPTDGGWPLQIVVFGAAAALTKFEGLPRVCIVAAVFAIEGVLARRAADWTAALALIVPALLVSLIWLGVEATRGITSNDEHVGTIQVLAIGSVALALLGVFGGVRTGGALLVVVLAWAASARLLFEPPLRVLTLVVLAEAAATLIAFLVSSTTPAVEVSTSATRLVQQWLPLALFVGAVGLVRTSDL